MKSKYATISVHQTLTTFKKYLFTGQEKCSYSQKLEAVSSHRCGRHEPVHDVHCQAAALKGQTEMFVYRDEPADQFTP